MQALEHADLSRRFCEEGEWIVHENGVVDATSGRRLCDEEVRRAIAERLDFVLCEESREDWVILS